MSYFPCTHKSTNDFASLEEGKEVWTCSRCGVRSAWSTGWRYYGSYACLTCEAPNILAVFCPACPDDKELIRQEESRQRKKDGSKLRAERKKRQASVL